MSLWKIAWRSMQQRALASTLTGLSMALGVALVVSVLVVYSVISQSFTKGAQGFDLIVGAKGGKLQLVLNTVYHLSTPVENIPYSYYKKFITTGPGNFRPDVGVAIPCCLGDNYRDFRVVGTTPQMFEIEYAPGQPYRFSSGRNFEPEHFFEAVVGAVAARETGLKVGDAFKPTHGVTGNTGHTHDPFTVAGILAPTGTPNDRALFVNIEGFYLLANHAKPVPHETEHEHGHAADHAAHEHTSRDHKTAAAAVDAGHAHDEHAHDDHEHGEHEHAEHDEHGHDHEHGHSHAPLPENQREVTAILVRAANQFVSPDLYNQINEGQVAQAVYPALEITKLFQGIVGNVERILLVLAGLVIVVAGLGILVSIYNSMSDRRRDIAVMRALGAERRTVLTIVLLESILLALAGGVAGFVLGHVLIGALSPQIVAQTGVAIGLFAFDQYELMLVPLLIVLAAAAGFLPGLAAYRTDVAKVLSTSP
ncbi:MAG TPA: FtsX-like permease family protein [Pirellulales bacterium]